MSKYRNDLATGMPRSEARARARARAMESMEARRNIAPPDWGTDEGNAMRAVTNEGHAECCQCELCVVQETDVVDPETRWAAFGQCGECNEPDRIMSQTRGLCVTCDAHLRGEW